MKKILNVLLATILFIPMMVNAAQCDTSKVYIDSISIDKDKTKGNVIELENATAKDKKVNLNLRMATQDDEILYKVVLKNDSSEDYEINKNSISLNSDYLEYSLESDNNNIVKANSTRTIYLRVKYAKAVDPSKFVNGVYNDNITMKVNLRTEETPANPNTGVSYLIIISLILLVSGLSLIIFKKKKLSTLMILIGLITLPIGVNALCTCEIVIDSKVVIKIKDEATVTTVTNCGASSTTDNVEFTIGTKANQFFENWIDDEEYEIRFISKDYFECNNEQTTLTGNTDTPPLLSTNEAIDNSCYSKYTNIVKPDDVVRSKDEGEYYIDFVGTCTVVTQVG